MSLYWLSDCFWRICRHCFNIWSYVAMSYTVSPKKDCKMNRSGFRRRKWYSVSGFFLTFFSSYLTTMSQSHVFGRMFVGLWIMKMEADPGGYQGGGLRPLDYWYRGFEPRWGHGSSFLVFVVRCVGSGLCDELISRSEESYPLCVSNYVWFRILNNLAA